MVTRALRTLARTLAPALLMLALAAGESDENGLAAWLRARIADAGGASG